ncbi:hypothetical protein D3C73_1011230 [compost metagenome]
MICADTAKQLIHLVRQLFDSVLPATHHQCDHDCFAVLSDKSVLQFRLGKRIGDGVNFERILLRRKLLDSLFNARCIFSGKPIRLVKNKRHLMQRLPALSVGNLLHDFRSPGGSIAVRNGYLPLLAHQIRHARSDQK